MKEEKWVSINEYNGHYEISNHGRVKSTERIVCRKGKIRKIHSIKMPNKILKTRKDKYGYERISLHLNNIMKTFHIHKLVAIHFIQNPKNKPEVNHIDGNKLNNCVDNLEWVTGKENIQHAHLNNLIKYTGIPVMQIDKDNKVVRVWNSGNEAARMLKIDQGAICRCCNKKNNHYKGYKWVRLTQTIK